MLWSYRINICACGQFAFRIVTIHFSHWPPIAGELNGVTCLVSKMGYQLTQVDGMRTLNIFKNTLLPSMTPVTASGCPWASACRKMEFISHKFIIYASECRRLAAPRKSDFCGSPTVFHAHVRVSSRMGNAAHTTSRY